MTATWAVEPEASEVGPVEDALVPGPVRRSRLDVHTGRIVAVEVAALLVALAATGGPVPLALSLPIAAAVALLAIGRWSGRPGYRWLADALRFAGRTRTMPAGADQGSLLGAIASAHVTAGELDGVPAGIVTDADGLAAVLDLSGPDDAPIPALSALLPPVTPAAPWIRVQVLVAAATPTGDGLAGSSYRQLTEGRIPARRRIVLAVRVCRDDLRWSTDDLTTALTGAVRRVRRRLADDRVTARPLDAAATLALVAELICHDADEPVRERWRGVRVGDRYQACVATRRLPATVDLVGQALTRLLTVPGTVTALSVTAGRDVDGLCADLAVRVAARDPRGLASAVSAVTGTLTAIGCGPYVPDGRHLPRLAATLPLARLGTAAPRTGPAGLDAFGVPLTAGLMLGVDRRQEPVAVDLLRADPTSVVLLGGLALAKAFVVRTLALGVEVLVCTGRPDAWEPVRRGLDPAQTFAVGPLGATPPGPASPLRPRLVVVDHATAHAGPVVPPAAWQAVLLLREAVSAGDEDALVHADLVLAQPLPADQATLVGAALGLGSAREWLSLARPDLLALISRRAVRWVRIAATPAEHHLIGALERGARR